MFPKFVVVITKHVPATPTTQEVNTVLEWRAADTKEGAEAALATKLEAHRQAQIPAASFGPGTVQVQGAIYTQAK